MFLSMCDARDIFRSFGASEILWYQRSINIGSVQDFEARNLLFVSRTLESAQ